MLDVVSSAAGATTTTSLALSDSDSNVVIRDCCSHQGFFLPTGGTKSPPTGYGIPDRFDRLPEKIGQIQISNKNESSIGLHWLADRFGR